eukprot:PITA_16372
MDHILQRLVGSSRISLLDGFSSFNQILVHLDDQDKTTFTTPWGTFKYVKMPFGLKNAGATFQRAMDIDFAKEIHDFLVVYLNDLTPFSKSDQEHLKHLRKIILTCRKYGISSNPKKSLFGLEEGKLLGHIISKDGIRIDLERIQAILQMPYPRNIKELQAFLGKINFLRRFIPNLAEMIRLLSNMVKKNSKMSKCLWSHATNAKSLKEKESFCLCPLSPFQPRSLFNNGVLTSLEKSTQSSSGQHKWILTATYYFTKWIEATPCRQANDSTIIQFLENNILSRFGCPEKIMTDNAATFKSKRMINFCHKYHITLGHSSAYYPHGNGLAESSNKSLINIIKKVLEENKNNWHKKLTNALWVDRLTTKRSIGMSPYELVYGMEANFPSSLGIPVIKLLQEIQVEPNDIQRRINQTIHLQQTREQVYGRAQVLQEKLKKMFHQRTKAEDFFMGSKVLIWDSRREDKGKHGKFNFLWRGPFIISVVQGNNTYFLKSLDGSTVEEGPVNGCMLKHYHDPI